MLRNSPHAVLLLLTARATAWDKAIVAIGRAAIEANMWPDFFHIAGDSGTNDKAGFVRDLVDPTSPWSPAPSSSREYRRLRSKR